MLSLMPLSSRRIVVAAALALSGAVALAAQTAGAEAVAIDFFVTGADGSVFDLRSDEVVVKVDGRPRQIRSLRYISLPNADPAGALIDAAAELEPPYGSNVQETNGRWVTIVVDHESIRAGAEKNTMAAAVRMVKSLGPRDRVSYVTMPNGGIEVDFTTDHDKVAEALRKFIGRAPREVSEQDRSCRSRLLLNSMRDYIEGTASLQGPKTIVLLSSGVLNPRRDAPADRPPGPCEIRLIYFQEVSNAATIARAHLFVVQPDDLYVESARSSFVDASASRFASSDADRAGLESLAGVTGGEFHRVVGPDDNTLRTAVQEMSGYYVATFEPDRGERNGFSHRVEVAVARERVRVRARSEVIIPRAAVTNVSASPEKMLRDGALYLGLPLRAQALTSAGVNGQVKVMSLLEPVEAGVTLKSAVFGLIDGRDRLVAQWTANADELAASPIVTAGTAPPGSYRLRVAAIDAAGRRGTTEYDFAARLTDATPVTISALVLGTSRDGRFAPRLIFGTDQAAVVYFEIYGTPPQPDSISVRLEIAASSDGRSLGTGSPRVNLAAADRRMVVGAIPIAPLAPGDYVVRAIVSVDGRPVGRVTRTLRKSAAGR
jgi:VWFA-related protein